MPDTPVFSEPSNRDAFFRHVLVMHEPRQEGDYTYPGGCRDCRPDYLGGGCPTYRAAWDAMKAEAGF